MLNVKGRSDYFLYAEIIKKITAFLILFITIPFGVKIMCAGLVLYAFADIIIIVWYVRKLTGIGLTIQLRALYPIILLSLSMGILVYGITLLNIVSLYQLLLGAFSGIVYYVGISRLFRFNEYAFLLKMLSDLYIKIKK